MCNTGKMSKTLLECNDGALDKGLTLKVHLHCSNLKHEERNGRGGPRGCAPAMRELIVLLQNCPPC